eukprot:scaffold2795_cov106-Isochrysis_galbana.AAC.3
MDGATLGRAKRILACATVQAREQQVCNCVLSGYVGHRRHGMATRHMYIRNMRPGSPSAWAWAGVCGARGARARQGVDVDYK